MPAWQMSLGKWCKQLQWAGKTVSSPLCCAHMASVDHGLVLQAPQHYPSLFFWGRSYWVAQAGSTAYAGYCCDPPTVSQVLGWTAFLGSCTQTVTVPISQIILLTVTFWSNSVHLDHKLTPGMSSLIQCQVGYGCFGVFFFYNFKTLAFTLYVYKCFTYKSIYVPCACLIHMEARKHQIWNWSHKW